VRFTVRLGILGTVFIAMFSIVALRLWVLQIAEGRDIAEATKEQTWVAKPVYAPRGDIFDRDETLLATTKMVPAVVIDRTFIQRDEERAALISRLSALLDISESELADLYEEKGPNARFQVAAVSSDLAFRINEQLDELPGAEIVAVPQRVYLSGPTLAHVIGHLGLPDQADLDESPDIDRDVRIGKLGVEGVYEDDLRGRSGAVERRVRSGRVIDERPPEAAEPGSSLTLTIDLETQEVVRLALEEGIALSNRVKAADRAEGETFFTETKRAAAVVLDPVTFEVLASASIPDFDPEIFVGRLSEDALDRLNEDQALLNRVIGGAYPPASAFKAITYTVIEEEDLPFPKGRDDVDPINRTVNCDGTFVLPELADGSQQVKNDWYLGRHTFGWLDIHGALQWSCNKFFWAAGLGAFQHHDGGPRETVLQDWAADLGYGAPTGIDLTGEAEGVIPSRAEFERRAELQAEDPSLGLIHPSRLQEGNALWNGGDLMDFAIGQGAFTATPMQVAVSYAALVNGGTVREPRVVSSVVGPAGDAERRVESPVRAEIAVSETTRSALLADLNRVVVSGTARVAFEGFGEGLGRVGGKTGTGQAGPNQDNHAWFVGVAPIDNPRFVVVVLIEEGGSGGRVAAPVARHILQHLMGNEPTEIVAGEETD